MCYVMYILVATFTNNVGVNGSLNAKSIVNIDLSTHVIVGHYAVASSDVEKFIIDLTLKIEILLNKAEKSNLNDLQHNIALVYITVSCQIHEIYAYRDPNNKAISELNSIFPILHYELVNLSVANFFQKI